MREGIIGILGGKGPEATVELLSLIIKNTPTTREEEHFRIVVDNNPKMPKPSLSITGEGPDALPGLLDTARNVERAGADFIAIPCNSAHYYIDQIRQAVRIPVLSIIEETAMALRQAGCRSVGLLATTGLLQAGLYQDRLARDGLTAIIPAPASQAALMTGIMRFKNTGELPPLTEIAKQVAMELADAGADSLAYACTEIPLAMVRHQAPRPSFDTIAILARACIRQARNLEKAIS
ncbi:MAG: amino acid racemase [Lentisphaerae bacterium]|nr:amino acid racemase [Lentisphaerota bacterium]